MIPLGLSARDRNAYLAALKQSQLMKPLVRIHDRNEKVISTVSEQVVGGQVNVDMSQSPNRTAEVIILAPRKAPAWLPEGPADYHVFANNFISIRYCVFVKDLTDGPGWVEVPIFWGPITGLSQDGTEVTIQASGKEILGLEPHLLWKKMELHKGRRRIAVIRDVLAEQGETRFDLPDLPQKLPKRLDLNRHAQPWRVAAMIAGGANWQIFCDGRGRVKVRRWPQNRAYTWHDGDNATILNRPVVSYDISSVRNVVEVMGPEPKGPPTRIREVARAPEKHHLSAESLKRNGQPRFMVETVDSNLSKPELEWHAAHKERHGQGSISLVPGRWGAPSGVKNPKRWFAWRHSLIASRKKKAKEIAKRHLANRLGGTIDTTFESIPVPHLEEGDPCAVSVDGWHFTFILKQFTIPLVSDAPMTVGTNRRVPRRDRKRRRQRKGYKPI